jgi:hypothetical protein
MRVSEKTVEINFCVQWRIGGQQAFWFGLTQEQEKRAGYDVMTRSGGRLLVLQFKASAHVLRSGERRFHAPHHQLVALQDRLRGSRDIYYVLPRFGRSQELPGLNWDIAANCYLFPVANIPIVAPPTRPDGALRKNGRHYFDLDQTTDIVKIHSDPVFVRAIPATEWSNNRPFDDILTSGGRADSTLSGERLSFESYEDFSAFAKSIGSKAMGYLLFD